MNMQRRMFLGNSQSLNYSYIYLLKKNQNKPNPHIKKTCNPPQQNKTQKINKTNKKKQKKKKKPNQTA